MTTTIRAIFDAFGALGWIELGAAFVVAVGCAGEFWIIANKLTAHVEPIGKAASRPWHVLAWIDSRLRPMLVRLKINRRKLPESKEHLLERFFVLLVAIGVTVEVLTLPFAMIEIAHLNKAAGDARKLAGEANERAGAAELLAANLNKEASTNRERAAKFELELEKIKAPRRISEEQRKIFISLLKDAPKCPIKIGMRNPSSETMDYEQQIHDLLVEAGYTITSDQNYPAQIYRLPPGTSVFFVYAGKKPVGYTFLESGFSLMGINTSFGPNDQTEKFDVGPGEVLIFVSDKN